MAEEKDPKDTPDTDDKGAEPKVTEPKVNVGPEGQVLKPGDENYLYAGKYKTVEEMEKGYSEAGKKITELGQTGAEKDKTIVELTGKADETRKAASDVEKEEAVAARKERAVKLKQAWDKSPEDALEFMESLIDEKQSGAGLMKRADYEKKLTDDDTATKEYNRVRGTGDSEKEKEFDTLKPAMGQIWAKLPKEAKVPNMIETVFLAAQAKGAPALKEKILAGIKAGHGQPPGGPSPEDKRTEDDKIIDGIVKQADKDRGKIT